MLADNEMDIHQSRLVIWHAAWVLDRASEGRTSRAWPRSSARRRSGASSTAACRSSAVSALQTTQSSLAYSAKSARSAFMTAPPRCIGGASPGGYCGREQHRDTDRRDRAIEPPP